MIRKLRLRQKSGFLIKNVYSRKMELASRSVNGLVYSFIK